MSMLKTQHIYQTTWIASRRYWIRGKSKSIWRWTVSRTPIPWWKSGRRSSVWGKKIESLTFILGCWWVWWSLFQGGWKTSTLTLAYSLLQDYELTVARYQQRSSSSHNDNDIEDEIDQNEWIASKSLAADRTRDKIIPNNATKWISTCNSSTMILIMKCPHSLNR